jgi:thiol:disulfide interchange protein DsbC
MPLLFSSPWLSKSTRWLPLVLVGVLATSFMGWFYSANAQEAVIGKALPEKLQGLPPIVSVTETPMKGLYEVVIEGNEILYTNADGSYFIQGSLVETATRRNLTQEKEDVLSAIPFDKLPLKDAFTVTRGKGERKMAMFSDPNCGFCKRIENDILKVDNVTIYYFMYPILGADSVTKAEKVWCAKDKGKVWLDYMTKGVPIPDAACNTAALQRNVAFGRANKINGTPAMFFADGRRVPGAVGADKVEEYLNAAKGK